ncbi:hypothetical protein GCK32_018566, partial [Trichostrongylus colubriformis]
KATNPVKDKLELSSLSTAGTFIVTSFVPISKFEEQNIYNNSGALSYYHQSQWSQPAASRPQYPPPPTAALNAGAPYPQSFKQSLGNLLGRYQATNNPTNFAFNYAAAAAAQPQQQQAFPPGSNLQQVLASLVQQSQYTNGGSNVPLSQ